MARVADRARPLTAVGIDAARTLVGPAGNHRKLHLAEIGLALLETGHLEPRAVAVVAGFGGGVLVLIAAC